MNYWLMKSEPDTFSIEDLKRDGQAGWEGVRNYQARNHMRSMRKGDLAFFYHSSVKPAAIVGVMEVVREAHPDPTQFNSKSDYYDSAATPDKPRWDQVEVRFLKSFKNPLTLEAMRGMPQIASMVLLNNSRLSVQPVTAEEWKFLERQLS